MLLVLPKATAMGMARITCSRPRKFRHGRRIALEAEAGDGSTPETILMKKSKKIDYQMHRSTTANMRLRTSKACCVTSHAYAKGLDGSIRDWWYSVVYAGGGRMEHLARGPA